MVDRLILSQMRKVELQMKESAKERLEQRGKGKKLIQGQPSDHYLFMFELQRRLK